MFVKMKRLKAVVRHPIYLPKHGLLTWPGYHKESELYLYFQPDEYQINKNPTAEQVKKALQTIWTPFGGFYLASPNDRAALLAGIFQTLVRPGLDIAPGLHFTAPSPASGKTLLATTLGALATGEMPGVFSGVVIGNVEEVQKLFAGIAQTSSTFVILDNLKGWLESATLEGVLTSSKFSGRLLGSNSLIQMELACTIAITTNNGQLARELARRFVEIKIDTHAEMPHLLEYPFNPVAMVLSKRKAIIEAVMTIYAAWLAQGQPTTKTKPSGFEEWDSHVRQVVLWLSESGLFEESTGLTLGDPAHSIVNNAGVNDPESEAHALLLEGLSEKYGRERFLASDAAAWMVASTSAEALAVKEAIEVLGSGRRDVTPAMLGNLLRRFVDRPSGGMVLRTLKYGSRSAYLITTL